ncbi:MAG: hypothetical protein KDD34_07485 [Bdellovibrionales bacterium]|nr:hypothetical protein [Bdellovibrionales bacterium]
MWKLKTLFLIVLMGMSSCVWAQDIQFDNIDKKDMENIVSDFTGVFTHTSVSGAAPLGSLFGFEVGLVLSGSKAEKIEKLVKEQDPNADIPILPSGGVLGIITVPLGFTFEALIIPEIGDSNFKFQNMSAAAKWSPTETVLSFLPLSIAIKGHLTKTDLTFKQPDPVTSSVEVNSTFKNTITGIQLIASKNLVIAEPYVGIGYIHGDGELSVAGNSIFDPSVTSGTSASATASGAQFFGGAEFKLLIFKLAAEYSHHLDIDRYSFKASAFF